MTRSLTTAHGPIGKGNGARARSDGVTATIGGIPIRNGDKPWWPEEGITKGDVARFYDELSPQILPWLAHRPLVAERCPEGMRGFCFFQKNFDKVLLAGVPKVPIVAKSTGRTVRYVVGGSKETLLSLVNVGCIAIHTMNCRAESLQQPDWLAFDLDPTSGEFADAARVGLVLKRVLEDLSIRSYPKTSGGRGLHVFVPLTRGQDQDAVRAFARGIGKMVVQRAPAASTVAATKSGRGDRVYVDTARNAFGQTIVAPYSIRRRPHAPVSTPLAWDEVEPTLQPARFNIRTTAHRVASADPWADFWQTGQTLPNLDGATQ